MLQLMRRWAIEIPDALIQKGLRRQVMRGLKREIWKYQMP